MKRLPRRLRLALLALVALLTLGVAFGLFLFSTVWAAPAPPLTPRRTIPLTDVNPYGANFFLEREVEVWKRQQTLQMARAAGIVWARQQFPWEEIEPQPGEFNWGKYDDLVALYQKNGLQIIARLDRPPLWARSGASGSGASGPPDNYDRYGDFVDAFVRRYSGKINYLQIWNEPNLGKEWNDAPIDPAAYVRLLKTAFLRARAADPNVRILTAPLAITLGEPYPKGEHVFRNMSDLDFLEQMYEAGAKGYFDILSANAFGLRSSPEDPPDPAKLNFQRVVLERQIMERYGDSGKSVWINEYGWNASPDTMPESKQFWGRVTEEQQADYTLRGIAYARKNWPWVGVISIWFFREVGDIALTSSEYYFRMVDPDFAPRPVYLRLKEAAASVPILGPGQYEETTPALQYFGAWKPHIDPHASLSQEMVTTDPVARLSFKFWGDRADLVARTGPGSGRLYVSVDAQPAEGLPRDDAGRSYVELAGQEEHWQALLPLARGLNRGEHLVELVASGTVNLDAVNIPIVDNSDLPWMQIVPLLALGCAAAYLVLQELKKNG